MIKIEKARSLEQFKSVFDGEIPDHNPASYMEERMKDGTAFVAIVDDQAAGFLIYNVWWGNLPFIELIKVNPKVQRQGIGSALLEAAKDEIKTKGFDVLISSTELSNPLGLAFHAKQSFRELNDLDLPHGEEKFYRIEL